MSMAPTLVLRVFLTCPGSMKAQYLTGQRSNTVTMMPTPCNPSQRHKALQSSQIDTPEARKEKHVKKMRNRSMTCSYNKVYSLVQEGESGQHGDLNQEHTESPDHLELHESAFED
jgi:hypothetical protein